MLYSVDNYVFGVMLFGCDGICVVVFICEMVGIVDCIGGGDVFVVGILYGMMCGFVLEVIVCFGLVVGCFKYLIFGDFNFVSEVDIMVLMGEE